MADAGLGGIRGLLVQNPRQSPPHPTPSSLRPRVVCSVSCFMDEVKLLENPRSLSITRSRSSPMIILIILPPFMHYLRILMPLAVRPYSNQKVDPDTLTHAAILVCAVYVKARLVLMTLNKG